MQTIYPSLIHPVAIFVQKSANNASLQGNAALVATLNAANVSVILFALL